MAPHISQHILVTYPCNNLSSFLDSFDVVCYNGRVSRAYKATKMLTVPRPSKVKRWYDYKAPYYTSLDRIR